ncbi:aminotransferase class I/II-fold pyridoxal phosphate-dependent enzyme [Shewanella sp. A32]|uniref:aminotransferase class I/II-fold pyridoxal phosphate-dependent enzyme n=1 Tax=Shewanella sp. A32 TaxID=3031327 RepID=UPI0023BA1F26|nr:aminotransferase class I/II-fold pyridoxal phosphate-dependent enzyme [Shewanella sp. A32]MDF0533883.1 aminotransferase class I/II-fold pyridoxal phosphate-dependent enzyme [Shewanella sp. A32]
MADSDTTNVQRRQFLKFSGAVMGGAALAGVSQPTLAKTEVSPTFKKPTADHPIRICWNENPLGMSPKGQAAAREMIGQGNLYPFMEMKTLQKMLADKHGVAPECVLLSAGATQGIVAAFGALATPDTQLVIPELTFSAGEEAAIDNSMKKITKVKMTKDWQIDLEAMKKAVADYDGPSIVYFVNPNNPTGAICKADAVEAWIKSKPAKTMFLMDEAYAEFASDPTFRSVSPLIKDGADNIVLLKTFSKLFAMAGMRVGWSVSTPAIIKKMGEKIANNNLTGASVSAAIASMKDDKFMELSRASNEAARKILLQTLDALKLDYVPSNTNFVFHKLHVPLADYQKRMKDAGIWVGRAFPPADEYCRCSLGTPEQMAYVAQVMLDLGKKGLI